MLTNITQRSGIDLNTDEYHSDITNPTKAELRPWENSDPFVSAHTREIVRTVFVCYIRQTISLFGIPGNIICCIVFLKQGLSDRINLLLFSLAVADFINVGVLFVYNFSCYIKTWDENQAMNWTTIINSKVGHFSLWASFMSGGLITIMSVDRCLSVVMPLKAGKLLPYRSMLVAILVVYLGLFLFHLPSLLLFTVKWRVDSLTNNSIAFIAITDWFPFDSRIVLQIYPMISSILKPFFVVVVTVCCIITIVRLRQAFRKRLQMQGGDKQESSMRDNKITKMLLFLCIVYVVLILPDVANQVTFYLVPEFYPYRKYHNTFVTISAFVLTASCLNSTVNFFAYLMLSSKFQVTLRELCQCCGRKMSARVRQHQ